MSVHNDHPHRQQQQNTLFRHVPELPRALLAEQKPRIGRSYAEKRSLHVTRIRVIAKEHQIPVQQCHTRTDEKLTPAHIAHILQTVCHNIRHK